MQAAEYRSQYREYASILVVLAIGTLGALAFGGFINIGLPQAIGIILSTFGVYTLAYVTVRRSKLTRSDRNLHLVWGYVPSALGIALAASPFVSFLFALSVALIGLSILAFAIVRW